MNQPFNVLLAQAYVPAQTYRTRWDPMKALFMGTIFPELYRDYKPRMMEAKRR